MADTAPHPSIPLTMDAMVLHKPGERLVFSRLPLPALGPGDLLVKISACGVCRTDLHIIDGELPDAKLPLIPGHEIIGVVIKMGKDVPHRNLGDVVGIPWLGKTCGKCSFCLEEKENLCDQPLFTGYTLDGGYAEYTVVDENYCFLLPPGYQNASAAPLLCAGLTGYRSYVMCGENVERLGIYGFGAAAHILVQLARQHGKKVYPFTKPGDTSTQKFALQLGAVWAADTTHSPEENLDTAIIFAPDGKLVPKALRDVKKGGTVVCGGIYMSDIPSCPYNVLWGERAIRSVANLTRTDDQRFFSLIADTPVNTTIQSYRLADANRALDDLRQGHINALLYLLWIELRITRYVIEH